MKLAIGWMISLRYTSSHACLLHRPSSLLSPCSRQSPWRPYNYFVFSLSQCSAVLLPSLLFKSLLHYYILLLLFETIISLYHHFYKRLFKQDFLLNSSQACFWSVLMCLWLVWNDLIWSHCRIAINLVMQCTILYWCFEHFKPWNQILWKPMRILLCGAAILDIVCIIGSLFYAYNIQMVVHTFTDLLYQDWNMCDNLVSKLKFC